ncbi:biotin attachment protein [Thiospirochaeta perfilievii]|uniref:Biotin attachment protein n=1 Tax=Thiospirochaeta perfilievii TaxID=252967 RepID=A0A5C1QAU8_9SPIO|nr:biotin/lipoyl-containing protein [Thiospirochaeta perfilievii]QEN04478.1 biotin attachment protein [Thiospirochaeta perfilievii]
MKKRINFMVTAFRDGFQSVYGARVLSKDFLPAVEAASNAGIRHFEAGGGARFQAPFFYCNENGFDVMDDFRKATGPDANLQTLSRGVNVVGLASQPRDIIKLHADLFKKHGMTTIRNFDALNDVNNLIYSGECIVNAGLKHEVCITMMELPPGCEGAHTPEFYAGVLRKILDANIKFDSICFKDASGTSTPAKVYDTIKEARNLLGDDMNIAFHSHETAGICVMQYKAALEAGASQIDLSLDPVSGGTCQPDVMTMWHALKGSRFDLGIDPYKIIEVEETLKDCLKDYYMPPEAKAVNPLIPFSPLPGGALTANTQMLRDNNLMDKYGEITKAMGEVVERGGFGTSVTPVSQFYFQQAFNNVMFGPWKKIADGYGKMVLGYFGETPCAPDPKLVEIAQEQLGLDPTTEKVVDINGRDSSLGIKAAKTMLEDANLPITDENIFIAAACREKGILFLEGKATTNIRKIDKSSSTADANGEYTVSVNGKKYAIEMKSGKAVVNGKEYSVDVENGIDKNQTAPTISGDGDTTTAPLPGLVLRVSVEAGATVEEGDEIMVLEAMKMESPITAKKTGIVARISVSQGDQVTAGQELFTIQG